MNNSKNLEKRFAGKILKKDALRKIKGGGDSDDDKRKETKAEKEARKRCEKAWKKAMKEAEKQGRRLRKTHGNGNGIW